MSARPRIASLALLAAVGAACSSIGDPGGMPEGNPHGGTGAFRPLERDETGIAGAVPGRAIVLRDQAVESAMAVDGYLFYVSAPLLDEPPEVPEDHPAGAIYEPAFGPPIIRRGESREEGIGAFDFGPEVLAASEPWEGGAVRDPWVFVDEDGSAHLYYAAAEGIGVAEAPSVDGTFEKLPGPVLSAADLVGGAPPRRPSVVRGPDGAILMYLSVGDEIRVARSEDGRRFEVLQGPAFAHAPGEEDEGESPEVAMIHPGAVRVETRAERTLVRLYFESVREDGTRTIYVAGSEDGVGVVRHPRPVVELPDVRFPSPVLLDDRLTLLYASLPATSGDYQTRAVSVSVGPAGQRFAPEDESATP